MAMEASVLEAQKLDLDTQSPKTIHHGALDNTHSTPVDPLKKVRNNGGHVRSVEQSPVHPRNQAKSWERKGSSEGTHGATPGTPSRMKMWSGGQGDESPDKGPTVPEFGEWEKDPASADGYTQLFNQMREERRGGGARAPSITNDADYLNRYNQGGSGKSGCCCFSWCRK